jgi:hypothetical protein
MDDDEFLDPRATCACTMAGRAFLFYALYFDQTADPQIEKLRRVDHLVALSMPTRKKRAFKAKDQEDQEDLPWSWADNNPDPPSDASSPQEVPYTAARHGRKVYRVGDTVQIKGQSIDKWIGLIRDFKMDYSEAKGEQMLAQVIWFCRQQDVKPVAKRREGAHNVTSLQLH